MFDAPHGQVVPKFWQQIFYNAPTPLLVLDCDKNIFAVSNKASTLLDISSASLEGRNADVELNLPTGSSRWSPTEDKFLETRIGGARVVFEVSHVSAANGGFEAIYLTITSLSRANIKLYEINDTSDSAVANDDEEWRQVQYRMIDELPATILAVSKDGKRVYQNAQAHVTLGPISSAADGKMNAWMQKQYEGACYSDGTPLDVTEYPIYRAAVSGLATDRIEVCFGKFFFILSGRPLYNRRGEHCGGMVFSTDVTVIKEEAAQKELTALQQSDVQFREITNNMEQIIWVSNADQVEYFNRRWYEYTGASEDNSVGTMWLDYVHPDDRQNTMNNWLLLLETDQDRYVTQHRVRGVDGRYRWFLARAIAMRDDNGKAVKWLGTSTDITQISEALEEAKKAKEQLFNIMQIAHVHYFVVSQSYKMTSAFLAGGHEGRGLYGRYKVEDLLDRDVRKLLPIAVLDTLHSVLRGEVVSSTTETEIHGFWWKTQFKVMRNAETGTILGVVGTAMDITEEKLKDEKLARASTERLVALQNSKFKGEFLARMSHEIRTPIGGILGMVQLMKDALQPNPDGSSVFQSHTKEVESIEYLESIKRCGDALLVIINDILDFSKIEVGKMDIECNPFDLHLMVHDVYIAAKHGPHKHNRVSLNLEYNLEPKTIFKGDNNRIRQILMNLMSNAMKFTETGTVTCRVELCHEEPTTSKDTLGGMRRVKFQIVDTGIGIPQVALDKLFNPFVQADSSTARKFGGTGLGLSIARQLVKLMSGALDLKSIPAPQSGHGSVATCIIPLEISSETELQRNVPAPLVKFAGHQKVLCVEDNKINQVIAQKTLEKLGLTTTLAENGQEAIDHLLALSQEDLPDIILMDCQMPLLDGYEATMQIRQLVDSRIRSIPIVAMTASAISGDREKCLAAGMNDYVSKPINPLVLSQTIRKYVKDQSEASKNLPSAPTNMQHFNGDRKSSHHARGGPLGLTLQAKHQATSPSRGHLSKRLSMLRSFSDDSMDTSQM